VTALLISRRAPSRDWSTFVESSTITTGLGLLSWVFVIHPQAADASLSLLGRAVVSAYPVCDVVVIGMLVRILIGGGTRQPALRCLLASLLVFLAGDLVWVVAYRLGWEPGGVALQLIQMDFLVAFALIGAAALHPSVREVGRPVPPRQAEPRPVLLATLTVVSLLAPALLAVQALRGDVTDGFAISVAAAVLFLLVLTRMAGLLRQVQKQSRLLRELARVDELTGLPNRRAWAAELPIAIERARRGGLPLSIAMIDLDFFKRFNDRYGHLAGDQLLKGAAAAWREQVRAVDQLARFGGEEFILLLPAATTTEAAQVVERLRAATPEGQTFSAGVATWDGIEDSDKLIARADAALYRAKEGGRNRTMAAETATQPSGLPGLAQTTSL
jgi:diguanylate cyclase